MRPTVIIFFILSIYQTGFSQGNSIEKLLDSMEVLTKEGKWSKAKGFGKRALEIKESNELADSLTAQLYQYYADVYIREGKLDSAQIWLDKGAVFLDEKGLSSSVIASSVYNTYGFFYTKLKDYNSAWKYYNKALAIRSTNLGERHRKTSNIYVNYGKSYISAGQYNQAFQLFDKALLAYQEDSIVVSPEVAHIHFNKGLCQARMSNMKEAVEYMERAIDISSIHTEKLSYDFFVELYSNITIVYASLGKYSKAEKYFHKSIEKIQENEGINSPRSIVPYVGLANVYNVLGNYQNSIKYSEKAISIISKTYGPSHPWLIRAFATLGQSYFGLKNYNKAIHYNRLALELPNKEKWLEASLYNGIGQSLFSNKQKEQAIENLEIARRIFLSIPGRPHYNMSSNLKSLGDFYLAEEQYRKAEEYYSMQLEGRINILGNPKHPSLIDPYLNLMKVACLNEEEEKFIHYEQKVNEIIEFSDSTPNDLNDLNSLVLSTNYLKIKADCWRAESKLKPSLIDSLENLYATALLIQENIQQVFLDRTSRNTYFEYGFPFYEYTIENLLLRGDEMKNRKERALVIVEKSKNRFLRETAQKLFMEKWSGLPAEIIDRENEILNEIRFCEKKRFEVKYGIEESRDSLMLFYEDKLLQLKEEFESLVKGFKTKYPEYYSLKYDDSIVTAEIIQKSLRDNQSILEFFVGEENIYVFLISNTELIAKRIALDFPLKDWVRDLRTNLYSYWTISGNENQAYKERNERYAELSFSLYQKLIEPVANYLTEELVIIPDDVLNYLPFEVLLKEQAADIGGFKNHAYLIKDHQISYHYSATLFADEMIESGKGTKKGLFIAPEFKEDTLEYISIAEQRGTLGPLLYNKKEASSIRNLLGGDLLQGTQATKSAFLERAENYQILHLSTHGKANDQQGDFSYLAFSEDIDSTGIEDRLYVQELYGMKLNADMVVLSACETGIGELQRGEGMISMARGFAYAGAQSTVTSLWKVDDAITSELMTNFYTYLKQGMTKDAALRQAKLDHLKKNPHADPYFWAGFIATGNMEAIELDNPWTSSIYWALLVLFLVVFLFFWYKKKRKSMTN